MVIDKKNEEQEEVLARLKAIEEQSLAANSMFERSLEEREKTEAREDSPVAIPLYPGSDNNRGGNNRGL